MKCDVHGVEGCEAPCCAIWREKKPELSGKEEWAIIGASTAAILLMVWLVVIPIAMAPKVEIPSNKGKYRVTVTDTTTGETIRSGDR